MLSYGTVDIDMCFLLQHYSLTEIMKFYAMKHHNHSMFRTIITPVYFDDAETMDPPKMFKNVGCETIKTFIFEKVREANWNNL